MGRAGPGRAVDRPHHVGCVLVRMRRSPSRAVARSPRVRAGRLYLGMHSPGDLVGGAVLAWWLSAMWVHCDALMERVFVQAAWPLGPAAMVAVATALVFAYPRPMHPTPSFKYVVYVGGAAVGIMLGAALLPNTHMPEVELALWSAAGAGPDGAAGAPRSRSLGEVAAGVWAHATQGGQPLSRCDLACAAGWGCISWRMLVGEWAACVGGACAAHLATPARAP